MIEHKFLYVTIFMIIFINNIIYLLHNDIIYNDLLLYNFINVSMVLTFIFIHWLFNHKDHKKIQ
jgi:hypothetical protein